jgi:ATP-dependent helicase HrpB
VEIDTLRQHHSHLLTVEELVEWDEATTRVQAVRRERLGAIVVAEQPLITASPEMIQAALLHGIRQRGLACLDWNREARQLQARVQFLRTWQPDADWPDLLDETLTADLGWLTPYLDGINGIDQLRRLKLTTILTALLGWERQQRLAQLAPETFTVPSGSRIRIDYRPGEPPILAVRLQELFGLNVTPAICGGRVPLLLHLLSPAQRPIQVTSDLAGFWQRGYPEVKKELKGRYPKHYWPDDPLIAEPVKGVKRTWRNQTGNA